MYPPGSGYPPNIGSLNSTCELSGASLITFSVNKAISGASCFVELTENATGKSVWSSGFGADLNAKAFTIRGTADGDYTLTADNGENSASEPLYIMCGGVVSALKLTVGHTDESATGPGSITLTGSGGTNPLLLEVVDLSLHQQTTNGTAQLFEPIDAGTYDVRVSDSSTPPQIVTSSVTVVAYTAPVAGCADEYATDYNPAATTSGACSYAPTWRSAWGPGGVAVRVPAVAGQTAAYVAADLYIGFRAGHPLAAFRPLGEPLPMRATVGPDGYATFRLGPYLRSALGAADGAGGYRLDLNSQTADDLYVGYELRRAVSAELLEHGYVVNAAVPDAQLVEGLVLSAFERVPSWPGFSWKRMQLASRSAGRFGAMDEVYPDEVTMPCPPNPIPVAWLNPLGAWDFWVFQGRPQLGDDVGDSQAYTEASTGQRRYSSRGDSRGTITASSGPFRGADLADGLRTLWASPQVWYQPTPDSEWVAVTLEGGSFPVRRLGVGRQEVSLTFTEAVPHYAQGQ